MGVIADLDCPEYAGVRCNYFVDRGPHAPLVVPRTEVPLLAAALAVDYLTPRYRRRIAALRGAAPLPAGMPQSDGTLPDGTLPDGIGGAAVRDAASGSSIAASRINVPADRVG